MSKTTSISSAQGIRRELNQLRLARQPLSVSSAALDKSRQYSTYLLEVKTDHLFIDFFIPGAGNDEFIAGEELLLEAKYSGTRYHFFCEYLHRGDDHTNLHHRLSMPSSLFRTEHRSDYRLHLRQDIAPNLLISRVTGNTQPAQLDNISLSGAGIRLPSEEKPQQGDPLKCLFHFNNEPVKIYAEIRHLRPLRTQKEIHIGVAFEPLPRETQRELHQELMRLQRHSIRTSASL